MADSRPRQVSLRDPVSTDDIREMKITTFDQRRQKICQVGNSIERIYNHVAKDSQLCVYPEKYSTHEELKLVFSERTREHSNSGLVFVTDNFSVSADISTDVQPEEVLFDVCLLVRGSPPTVLSVVRETHVDQQKAQFYNLTLARGLVQAVRRFTDEQFSVVYGLITKTQLNSQETFRDALLSIKKKTSALCVPGALKLPDAKLKKISLALLSVISLTDSVQGSDNGLWFLTLEQFVILTENIDQRQVTVRTAPSSGGKVLMREVAKRLERSGPTLLVMESEDQIQVAREKHVCSYMKTKEEWTLAVSNKEDLPGLTHMVTNCPNLDCANPPNIAGRTWTFLFDSYGDHDIAENQPSEIVDGKSASRETNINTDTHQIIVVQPVETVAVLRDELKQKSIEIEELKDENQKLRETEEELSRMLDSVSLGGRSLDSAQGSDVSSLVSFGSLSSSTSNLNVDRQGATGGQGGARKLLKRVKKSLMFGRSRRDLGTIAEEGRKNTSIELKRKNMEIKELNDENQKLRQTQEKLGRMLDSVSLGGLSLDSGRGSDVGSLASLGSVSSSTSELRVDLRGAWELLKRVNNTLAFGRSREDLETIAEDGRRNTSTVPLCPIYVTPEGPLYVLTERKNRKLVYMMCRQHKMDRDRVNAEYCHVTEDGQLDNSSPGSRSHYESRRIKNYDGTCSTSPIPLPTSTSFLTPVPPAPQYWETETAVEVKMKLEPSYTVLEVGVVDENKLDRDMWVYNRLRSWRMMVTWCDSHKGYCTQVWNEKKRVKCGRDTLSDTPGSPQTLRYGVAIDTVRGRLGFVDVDRGVVLEKMDVEFRQTVYPVFAVYPDPDECSVQMRLVSGSDIQMTKDKQKLICSCTLLYLSSHSFYKCQLCFLCLQNILFEKSY